MPECYLDTNLVEALLGCENEVNHKKGNSTLLETMETRLSNIFVVALIDDDKVKLKKLKEYVEVKRLGRNNLKIFQHPGRKHYVIQVSPAIEKWILNQCNTAGIRLSDFDIPEDIKSLKALKSLSQRNDVRFKKLFKLMVQNKKCKGIIELNRWLNFFFEHNYNVDIDLLQWQTK